MHQNNTCLWKHDYFVTLIESKTNDCLPSLPSELHVVFEAVGRPTLQHAFVHFAHFLPIIHCSYKHMQMVV